MSTNSSSIKSSAALAEPAFVADRSRTVDAPLPSDHWMPPSWREELKGFIFLPRTLRKGRRVLAGRRQGRNLMNGFLFGDFDYADGSILRFLRTKETRVLELLGESEDDAAVADTLIRESGRSAAEIKAWNRRFRTINGIFLAMWDADEGRRAPGVATSLLKWSYNYGLMPPVYVLFRIAQRLRPRPYARYN